MSLAAIVRIWLSAARGININDFSMLSPLPSARSHEVDPQRI
jgi:hypothetical protein